jgi:hypothetical protein
MVGLIEASFPFACSQPAMFAEFPRSYVETTMKPKLPAFGEQMGCGLGPPGAAEGTMHGMSVMSKVMSNPGGSVLACAFSMYRQVAG